MRIDQRPERRVNPAQFTHYPQRTFRTALESLPKFTAGLLSGQPSLASATVLVEGVVFVPRHLHGLMARNRLSGRCTPGLTITAIGAKECASLLRACLGDWVDFYYLPEPSRFVLFADHDEYTTVFSDETEILVQISSEMARSGFEEITDYVRPTRR